MTQPPRTSSLLPDRAIRNTLETLSDFYSQPGLSRLRDQLQSRHRWLRPILYATSWLRRSKVGIALLFWVGIAVFSRPWFARRRTDIYALSLTDNNRRALARISKILSTTGTEMTLNATRFSLADRVRAGMATPRRRQIISALAQADEPDHFVFLHQVLGATSLVLFHEDLSAARPRLVCTANDHSPPAVALLSLARALDVTSCYVQHGPVTDNFPPLRTDLAILYNTQARDAYHGAAARRGHPPPSPESICLLPVLSDPWVPMQRPQSPLDVCIALSFFPNLELFEATVATLSAHPAIGTIRVTRHPRSRLDLSETAVHQLITVLPLNTSPRHVAEISDMCIVANSGVALEFLHFGCPTFYWENGDTGAEDYYGFVAAKILPRFDSADLDTPETLTAFFDTDWQRRMTHFDPSIETETDLLEQQMGQRIHALLDNTTSPAE